jgi:hypothetical protein
MLDDLAHVAVGYTAGYTAYTAVRSMKVKALACAYIASQRIRGDRTSGTCNCQIYICQFSSVF